MARKEGKAEIQHFVPQLMLRLHATDPASRRGTEQVWCFDKRTDRIFQTNVKNICAESRFYESETDERSINLEEYLAGIEDRAGPILTRIVQSRTLSELNNHDRRTVAEFAAIQLVRTRASREIVLDVNRWVAARLSERGIDPATVPDFLLMSEADAKAKSLEMIVGARQYFSPHFADKHWYLIDGHANDPFHLGDHPVVRQNEFEAYGGMTGIASPGISIYLPLCPTLSLCMLDAHVATELKTVQTKTKRELEKLRKRSVKLSRCLGVITPIEMIRDTERIERELRVRIRTLLDGGPTAYDHEVVTRVNALQMAYATRWVISSLNDFSLPKAMIADNEGYRHRAPPVGPVLTPRKSSRERPPPV